MNKKQEMREEARAAIIDLNYFFVECFSQL